MEKAYECWKIVNDGSLENLQNFLSNNTGYDLSVINEKYKDNPNNRNALITAVYKNKESAVGLLLRYGMNVNAKDDHGWTAGFYAVKFNRIDVLNLLIKEGLDVHKKNNENSSLLHWARSAECVRRLSTLGVDPNGVDIHGKTPLHNAIYRKEIEVMKTLIEAGANPFKDGVSLYSFIKGLAPDWIDIFLQEVAKKNAVNLKGILEKDIEDSTKKPHVSKSRSKAL